MSRNDEFSRSGGSRPEHRSEHPKVGQVKEVTSLANPIVKDLRSLALKKFRDQQGVFLAEGLKLVIDALEQDWRIKTLVFAKSGKGNKTVEQVAARTFAKGGLVLEVTEKVISAITRRDNPQMVVGVFEQQYHQLASLKPKGNDVYVALDRVRDPGNLGTVIRTADAVGAKGVILIGDTTDPYSLETVRATMGSVFSVPLYRASEADFLNWRKGFSGLVVGTHLKGAVDYRTIPYANKPVILMMGNEQQGLPDSLAGACDKLARIPQAGRADSLNLAIATGVMLYEIRREALTLDERG
ncbi:RNA methyltransferase [Brucella sp. BO3]|uniref:TrmH family RNA methyltransferase n=1 Tax=unclassified Brucella TaxID=2632610 RepID=UPI00084FA585|nr:MULTISPECIES: RNA methyltransferase [unclassified Brucella]OEI84381.1 RNA methyltransferase [Brucella sp. B13-0095]QMV25533.1 RNA methyltransferase [Brucella sp. BO3]